MGLPLKSQEISLVKMRSSLRCFYKKDFYLSICTFNISSVFLYQLPLFLHGCKNPICSYAFSTKIGLFFRRHFCINSYWNQKKVLENKVSCSRTLFPKNFCFKDFYSTGLFYCQNVGHYFRKLFS